MIPTEDKNQLRLIIATVFMHGIISRRRDVEIAGRSMAVERTETPIDTAKLALAHADALIEQSGMLTE